VLPPFGEGGPDGTVLVVGQCLEEIARSQASVRRSTEGCRSERMAARSICGLRKVWDILDKVLRLRIRACQSHDRDWTILTA